MWDASAANTCCVCRKWSEMKKKLCQQINEVTVFAWVRILILRVKTDCFLSGGRISHKQWLTRFGSLVHVWHAGILLDVHMFVSCGRSSSHPMRLTFHSICISCLSLLFLFSVQMETTGNSFCSFLFLFGNFFGLSKKTRVFLNGLERFLRK